MSGMDLFREIGMIDEKYIVEAEETKRSLLVNPVWRRSLATAACLCLCVGLYFSVQRLGSTSSDTAGTESIKVNTTTMEAVEEMVEECVPETASEKVEITGEDEENELLISQETADGTGKESYIVTESAKEDGMSQSTSYDAAYYGIRDLADVSARFADYPDTLEGLLDAGLVVNLHGTIKSGQEKLDAFLTGVEAGTAASLELVQFTVEGDAMFYYIDYDGVDFYAVVDYSRDEFAGDGEKVHEYEYKYLKVFEEQIEGGVSVEILLTDEEGLTLEKHRGESNESFCIMTYME